MYYEIRTSTHNKWPDIELFRSFYCRSTRLRFKIKANVKDRTGVSAKTLKALLCEAVENGLFVRFSLNYL